MLDCYSFKFCFAKPRREVTQLTDYIEEPIVKKRKFECVAADCEDVSETPEIKKEKFIQRIQTVIDRLESDTKKFKDCDQLEMCYYTRQHPSINLSTEKMDAGYVYVLTNESMPEQCKIGMTMRTPEVRAAELSSTSVPTSFVVKFAEKCNNPSLIEKQVHAELSEHRTNGNREFFNIQCMSQAITLIQQLCSLEKQSV